MHIPVAAIRLIQGQIGIPKTKIDGVAGPQTEARLDQWFKTRQQRLPDNMRTAYASLSRRRKLTACLQILATDSKLDPGPIDGFWGPQTAQACTELLHLTQHGSPPPPWRDTPSAAPPNPNAWPKDDLAALKAYYGNPGSSQLVTLDLPYTHRLSWDLNTHVNRLSCHSKVADSLTRVLTKVLAHYGHEQLRELRLDRYGGCYNKRRMRGGSRWSTHAWGIALDYDPERNQLKWSRERAAFAGPQYDAWWSCWEAEGWVSLGRNRNFDWMHVQAARL